MASSKNDPSTTPASGADSQPQKIVVTASQAKRLRQNVKGILISVGLCLAVVLPIYFLAPQPEATNNRRDVDVAQIAAQAQDTLGYAPVVADLPEGFTSTYARVSGTTAGTVPSFEVGLVSPESTYIQFTQSAKSNPTWVQILTKEAPVTGERIIDGRVWELRDKPGETTSLVLTSEGIGEASGQPGMGQHALVLTGQASIETLESVAKSLQLSAWPAQPTPASSPG